MKRVNTPSERRGSILAVLVVVMALMGLIVVGMIRPLRDEAALAALRVETVRAYYAAQSGVAITRSGYAGASELPSEGDEVTLHGQTVVFVKVPESSGVVEIEGRSGDATRRIEFEVE